MKYSLGAIQYFWPKAVVQSFYKDVADDAGVDIVYLGETVCQKRTELRFADYMDIAHQLREAGKTVCLSTMTLLESPSLVRDMVRYVDNGEFMVEANDVGAIQIAREKHLPFVAGAAINCYNQHSLKYLLQQGMQRWVMPVELSRDWLQTLIATRQPCRRISAGLKPKYLPLGIYRWPGRHAVLPPDRKTARKTSVNCAVLNIRKAAR